MVYYCRTVHGTAQKEPLRGTSHGPQVSHALGVGLKVLVHSAITPEEAPDVVRCSRDQPLEPCARRAEGFNPRNSDAAKSVHLDVDSHHLSNEKVAVTAITKKNIII